MFFRMIKNVLKEKENKEVKMLPKEKIDARGRKEMKS